MAWGKPNLHPQTSTVKGLDVTELRVHHLLTMGASAASTTRDQRHQAMLTATLINLRSKGDEVRRALTAKGWYQDELSFCPTLEDEYEGLTDALS